MHGSRGPRPDADGCRLTGDPEAEPAIDHCLARAQSGEHTSVRARVAQQPLHHPGQQASARVRRQHADARHRAHRQPRTTGHRGVDREGAGVSHAPIAVPRRHAVALDPARLALGPLFVGCCREHQRDPRHVRGGAMLTELRRADLDRHRCILARRPVGTRRVFTELPLLVVQPHGERARTPRGGRRSTGAPSRCRRRRPFRA